MSGEDKRQPWMKWYPADWRADPALRMCSLAARGLWVDLIGFMHEAAPYGHLVVAGRSPSPAQIAALVGVDVRTASAALAELEGAGVFSRTEDGTIYSRRMLRDKAKVDTNRINGKGGGNPNLVVADMLPKAERHSRLSRKDNPTKVEAVWLACEGICLDCGTPMQRDRPNMPDAFTIDHITPIACGGTNASDNLRGVCRSCNLAKGVNPHRAAGVIGQPPEGDKAQKPETREDTSSLRSDGAAASELWSIGLARLVRMTGKSADACRKILGRLLRDTDDDCELLNRKLLEAEDARVLDPVGWLEAAIAAAQGRRAARPRPGQGGSGYGQVVRALRAAEGRHGAGPIFDGTASEVPAA